MLPNCISFLQCLAFLVLQYSMGLQQNIPFFVRRGTESQAADDHRPRKIIPVLLIPARCPPSLIEIWGQEHQGFSLQRQSVPFTTGFPLNGFPHLPFSGRTGFGLGCCPTRGREGSAHLGSAQLWLAPRADRSPVGCCSQCLSPFRLCPMAAMLLCQWWTGATGKATFSSSLPHTAIVLSRS